MENAEELKQKIAVREAEKAKKAQILRELDTRKLIEMLTSLEEALEEALREETNFKNLNYGYLSSGDHDCAEVKLILAELSGKVPSIDGKKPTLAEKDNWLIRQRSEHQGLMAAIDRQCQVAFALENHRISSSMAKTKMENVRAVLALKTAQIEFLT